jgi:hypothetical protein
MWFYYLISRIFGYTFGIKLMERGEEDAQANYERLKGTIKEIEVFLQDENNHEHALIDMLDEESLRYAGSVVLGLNDALVELTGALAGLTLALQNTQLIALSGLIHRYRCCPVDGRVGIPLYPLRRDGQKPPQGLHLHRYCLHYYCGNTDPALPDPG